ncbi:MAG: hypothetical protein ACFB51_21390 [Anaerolineae bacterium]
MVAQLRLLALSIILLLLAGCAQEEMTIIPDAVVGVNTQTITWPMQYFDNQEPGPIYDISLTVPEEWVDAFIIQASPNQLVFEYIVDEDITARIFYVEALSEEQYWAQIGSYPGLIRNIRHTGDTYFIYYVPIYSFYAGLPEEEYEVFTQEVPSIIRSFDARVVGPNYFGNQ